MVIIKMIMMITIIMIIENNTNIHSGNSDSELKYY